MFDEFNGLPIHTLALHVAVVLVPLAAVLGVLFAIARTRSWSRVPLLVVSVGAVAAVYVAKESGERLQQVLNLEGPSRDLVDVHAARADVLFFASIGYAVLAVAAFVVTRNARNDLATTVLAVLLVVGAVGVAFQTYRVGDVGARAVWNPTGEVDYGSTAERD